MLEETSETELIFKYPIITANGFFITSVIARKRAVFRKAFVFHTGKTIMGVSSLSTKTSMVCLYQKNFAGLLAKSSHNLGASCWSFQQVEEETVNSRISFVEDDCNSTSNPVKFTILSCQDLYIDKHTPNGAISFLSGSIQRYDHVCQQVIVFSVCLLTCLCSLCLSISITFSVSLRDEPTPLLSVCA